MLNARIPAMRSQALIGAAVFIFCLVAAWEVGGTVAGGDLRTLEIVALGFVVCAAIIATMRDWRTGFYLFFVFMMFEDLPRKYLGNNVYLFFGKDVLLGFVYLSFYLAVRRRREKTFRPPFLLFFSLFFFLGVLQIFNPYSPSILYGLLGLKLYFYYVPLLFVGYALIRNDEDLRKFLAINAALAGVIGGLGIVQAIVGQQFLNPEHLAPELENLGNLSKISPLTHQIVYLPDSVFVSAGRFAIYLVVVVIVLAGAAGYLLLHTARSRKTVLVAFGVLGTAVLLSGSRGTIMGTGISLLALCVGFLWGAPWRWRQAHRLVRAIRRSFLIAAFGVAALILLFPNEAASRLAFYTETLSPDSSSYELSFRSWEYPINNLLAAFDVPNWMIGNGTGTASLSTQYVSKVLGRHEPMAWVEEGYGDLVVEMGILAPFLWILWSASLLYYGWKVVRRLRETRLFPIAFAIWWYAFWLLYPWMFGGLWSFQNYISNAYLWLLVGMLFRLPDLLASPTAPVTVSPRRFGAHGGFQF